jgi:hypothetical protein
MDLSAVPANFRKRVSADGKYADFSRASFTSLPDWVCTLTSLTTLRLDDNQLAELPDAIGNLVNLTELFLPGNRLARLPNTIGNLINLRWLRLNNNRLVELPDTIGNLTSLTGLEVSGNQLTQLPRGLANILTHRLELTASGNPMADPLPELIRRGQAELAAYLRSLEDAAAWYEAKVLLVGEIIAGHSSKRGAFYRRAADNAWHRDLTNPVPASQA